jgi:hypothetical protein
VPRMIELMRQSAVPANVMRSASKGALDVPPAEMLEILVYLTANPVFNQDARMTLAGWDEAACHAALADPKAPREVLDYFLAPANRRPRLLPALIENPAVAESALLELAQEHAHEIISLLLASPRVKRSRDVLHVLTSNPGLTPVDLEHVRAALAALGETVAAPTAEEEAELAKYVAEHAAEIAAEEGKAFELVGGHEEGEPVAAAAATPPAAAAAAPAPAKQEEAERISPLQKISRLTVGQRVQLAMRGNKEERFILIRDGSKVVSSAVLESPKVTDQEIETFASLKNVQESVLRGIAGKRKFMKSYSVVKNLVNNPRCPLDIQLNLVKNLLVNDLRNLSNNKNVSETIRKLALKLFKDKTDKKGGGG